MYKTPIKY